MSAGKVPTRVRKRDGSDVAFEELRLVESLEIALETAGENPDHARQFTEVVMLRLAQEACEPAATTSISEHVETVLREYGCPAAATAYRSYRFDEEELVADLRVHGQDGREERSAPWDRARLARSLMRDRYLEGVVSRRIARRVERRAIAMALRHLTGRLVAALADNECRTAGLASGPPTPERLGLDRRHLRAWLGGSCLPLGLGGTSLPTLGPDAQDPRPALGEELLARFALEEVFGAAERESWSAGRFEVPGLGDWLRPVCVRLRPGDGEEEDAFWQRVAEHRPLSRELQVFVPAWFAAGTRSAEAPLWLRAAGCRMRFVTADSALAEEWSRRGYWHAMPVAAYLALPDAQRAGLAEQQRTLLQWQPPQPRLPPTGERARRVTDRSAVINLAAAARAAGAWEEAVFHAAVSESLADACRALMLLARRADAESLPRIVLLPAGLRAAAEILFPDAGVRNGRMRRFVLALRDVFDREPRKLGLRAEHFAPPLAEAAGARLAERSEAELSSALDIGWCSGLESGEMVTLALDTAPWLELPAAAVESAPWAARLLPGSARPPRETV
ncbi:MAG: ATP cone domain-containing protein [Planctomycetota bacterium]|nr:ATP cone domain-containing protein [Planctomycetota bacterium]